VEGDYPLAIKAGLSGAVAADLRDGRRPSTMQPDEAVLHDRCVELSTKYEASISTVARARQIISEQQIVDLVTVSGTYVLVVMQFPVGKEDTPDGAPPLPPLPAGWAM